MQSNELIASLRHGGRSLAMAMALVVVSSVAASCALSTRIAPELHTRVCADALADTDTTAGWRLSVDADCTLRVRDKNDAVTAQLRVSDPQSGRVTLQRIVASSKWLFVLRRDPGRLEVYQLPTLVPVEVIGMDRMRVPSDLALREGADGNTTAYILDNAYDSDRDRSSDESVIGGQVLRVSLTQHTSARRDVIIADLVDRFGTVTSDWYDWRTLQSIDLSEGEIRIVVHENRQRYVEYFTFDGVRLERQRLVGSR